VFTKVDYVMVMVSDMKRSVNFYKETLGLPLKFESEEWTEFQTGTTTLALHGGAKPSGARGREELQAGTCSIGFSVADLEKTWKDLRARGVHFVMPPTEREGEGIKLAIGVDPDGLPLSFAERTAEA
jgi:catechol 2,3-dioxygenase-like lactoylglutathione lyase family enzyme